MVALQEKTICYCSSFDLSADDWLQSYRNLRTFTTELQSNLGKHIVSDHVIVFDAFSIYSANLTLRVLS